eukprot:353109-Chlamydomonas_euryale.AAC.3
MCTPGRRHGAAERRCLVGAAWGEQRQPREHAAAAADCPAAPPPQVCARAPCGSLRPGARGRRSAQHGGRGWSCTPELCTACVWHQTACPMCVASDGMPMCVASDGVPIGVASDGMAHAACISQSQVSWA